MPPGRKPLRCRMASGLCRLCLQNTQLVKSHLMPAALYKYCRGRDCEPIKIAGGMLVPTSQQTQDYLLCAACEDVLNKGGERWLVPRLATIEREFPFYELLRKAPPNYDDGWVAIYYASNNSEISCKKIAHFAMGIFWKASAHSWRKATGEPKIQLGPYSEPIRLWLRGGTDFPEHMALLVYVSPPLRAQIVFSEPCAAARDEARYYFFYVPGILFMLTVGKTLPRNAKSLSFFPAPTRPIIVTEFAASIIENLFADLTHRSRKSRGYTRYRKMYP